MTTPGIRDERPEATVPLPNGLAYAVATVALVVAVIQPFAVLAKGLTLAEAVDDFFLQNGFAFAVLGSLILSRRPGHVIGWLLVAVGGTDAFTHIGDEYELFELGSQPGFPAVTAVEAVIGWLWVPTVALIGIALPQLFPNGRLLSRRWQPLAWFGAAATALLSALFIVDPSGVGLEALIGFAVPLFGLAMLTSLVPLVLRYRRSRGVERQQLKWVFYGLAVSVPLIVLGTAGTFWGASAAWSLPALVILPVMITVAVLRYRLYDIDVVISRTLLVAGLAGFITAAYVGIVVGVGSLVGGGDEPDLALSVVATAVVAVAFQPVRRGLQRVANRLVFGRRATPYDVLSGFATRVGAAEPSSDTLVQLAELMARGTGADPARVWLRVGSELRPAATWPPAAAAGERPAAVTVAESDGTVGNPVDPDASAVPVLPDTDLAVPVRDGGELLGVLTVAKPRGERLTEIDTDLLGRLAAASGVLLRNLRRDAALAQRLTDREAARRRLLRAQN
ncbi:MAG: GAF domain-containing protein, partial [Geodermatophilaceae bacterium]